MIMLVISCWAGSIADASWPSLERQDSSHGLASLISPSPFLHAKYLPTIGFSPLAWTAEAAHAFDTNMYVTGIPSLPHPVILHGISLG